MSESALIPLATLLTRPIAGKLPVDPDWKCVGSGECCSPGELIMTKEEAAVLTHAAPPGVSLSFRPLEGNFVALKASPCPLFIFKRCTVYEARPYNCRRFMCMRPDVKAEPFRGDGNWKPRVDQSREARRAYALNQRKHSRWALSHGWAVQE